MARDRGQDFPNQRYKVTELKRLSDKTIDCQSSKGAIDSISAIGAGEDYLEIRTAVSRFFEDLPAGDSRQSHVQ
jgi:hypothetical protein